MANSHLIEDLSNKFPLAEGIGSLGSSLRLSYKDLVIKDLLVEDDWLVELADYGYLWLTQSAVTTSTDLLTLHNMGVEIREQLQEGHDLLRLSLDHNLEVVLLFVPATQRNLGPQSFAGFHL